MGTRADFYIGRGNEAEWLGSIAWDGHPDSVFGEASELSDGAEVDAVTWRRWVSEYIGREDGTTPDLGWPWPWDDSRTTDYAYALDDGAIYGSSFGHQWFRVDPKVEYFGESDADGETVKTAVFPDMTARKNVTYGKRSGVIIVSRREPDREAP